LNLNGISFEFSLNFSFDFHIIIAKKTAFKSTFANVIPTGGDYKLVSEQIEVEALNNNKSLAEENKKD